MSEAAKINKAVKLVRDEVGNGAALSVAVTEAAELFELNPALVERKFHEQYGLTEAQLASIGPTKIETKQGQLRAKLEETSRKYGPRHPMFGKKFEASGKAYLLVTIREGVDYPLVAIQVDSQEEYHLGRGWLMGIERA